METEDLRSALVVKDKKRGALRSFCEQHDLPYFKVWRFAKSKTVKIEHDLGLRVSSLIKTELDSANEIISTCE